MKYSMLVKDMVLPYRNCARDIMNRYQVTDLDEIIKIMEKESHLKSRTTKLNCDAHYFQFNSEQDAVSFLLRWS